MAIKKFINSGLLYQDVIIDRFRQGAGLYETPDAIENQKSANWQDKKINFAVYSSSNDALELGEGEGCFDINDISRIIPIAIYSNVTTLPYDEAGRLLAQFTETLYGSSPGQTDSPLVNEPDKGFLPFGDAGIFNKTFFNTMFYDHNFEFDMPEKNNNIVDEIIAKEGTTTYGIEAEYNYYVKEYEDTIAKNDAFESMTPYLYSFADAIYNANMQQFINIITQEDESLSWEYGLKYKNPANRKYLNDPRRQIFLGGSSGEFDKGTTLSFDIKGALGLYWPEQNKFSGKYRIDFWPDNDALQWIAICENSMKNKAYKGFGDYGPDLIEYNFKGKQISFAGYFKSWSYRYNNPAGEDLAGNAEGNEMPFANLMRNWLQYKYKNILFSDMDLMKYNFGFKDLFPMNVNISLDNPLHNYDGNEGEDAAIDDTPAAAKDLMFQNSIFEPLMRKFIDTTCQNRVFEFAPNLKQAYHSEPTQEDLYYDPEYLLPLTLNYSERRNEPFVKQRTGLHEIDISNEGLWFPRPSKQTKMIDFKEFISTLKQEGADYSDTDSSTTARLRRNTSYYQVGKDTDVASACVFGENCNDEGEPDSLEALADIYSSEFYEFVSRKFHELLGLSVYSIGDPAYDPQAQDPASNTDGSVTHPFGKVNKYNEILAFRLSKHEVDENNQPIPKAIQNIYFPNTRTAINYIDSQVKYGKKYHYQIHAITLVIGLKYFYRNPTKPVLENTHTAEQLDASKKVIAGSDPTIAKSGFAFWSQMELVVQPDVVIAEVPYATLGTINMISAPPVGPSVQFFTYKKDIDSNNDTTPTMDIFLQNSTVSHTVLPKPIEDTDFEYYQDVLAAQNLSGDDAGKIFFSADDPVAAYRVYRLETKPLDLVDFANSYEKHNSLEEENILINQNLEYNKKYWYTFRSEDIHGGVSNPTHIYEIELVSLSDGLSETTPVAIYPVIKSYAIEEFFTGTPYPKKKSFKKYIHIRPAVNQERLQMDSYSGAESANDVEPVFGENIPQKNGAPLYVIGEKQADGNYNLKRKVKIRLTSKATGRKIDLNVNFNHIHVPWNIDNPNKENKVVGDDD
tara:strand:+ start:594 stop:3815 length:3222 start_codon:yes stop_codon:yes gene_type:complete